MAAPSDNSFNWAAADREAISNELEGDPARRDAVLQAISLVEQSRKDSNSPLRKQAEELIVEPLTYYGAVCTQTHVSTFCQPADLLKSFHEKFSRSYP